MSIEAAAIAPMVLFVSILENTVGITFFSTATLIPPATAVAIPIEAPVLIPTSITSSASTSFPVIRFTPIFAAIPIPTPIVPLSIACLPICFDIEIVLTSFLKLSISPVLFPLCKFF